MTDRWGDEIAAARLDAIISTVTTNAGRASSSTDDSIYDGDSPRAMDRIRRSVTQALRGGTSGVADRLALTDADPEQIAEMLLEVGAHDAYDEWDRWLAARADSEDLE